MTDDKLLDKIEKIVDKSVTRIVDKRITESEIKTELRFNSVDKELKKIRKQQDQDREDFSEFFHEIGVFIEEMRSEIMKRIERIENHLGFSKN